MTNDKSHDKSSYKNHAACGWRLGRRAAGLGLALGLATTAHGWTTLPLPDLISAPPHYGALTMTHLADGRLLYGNNNQLYVQKTYGAATVTPFATVSGDGVDPSFIAVLRGTVAVVGAGMFGTSSLYQFDPQFPATPGYASIATMQNYSGVAQGPNALYVAGDNGSGASDAVFYVRLNGTSQLLIDQVAIFSAGIARDTAGDLFVGDNDSDAVYEFTAAQLQKAISTNTTLTLGNGTLVHTFASDVVGGMAVDTQGRLWASGFGDDGLFWWDPAKRIGGVLTPEASGGAYSVSAFTRDGKGYISFLWQAGFSPGDGVEYGYAAASDVLAPVINQQPSAATAARGSTANFSVSATSPAPLTQTYAWQKNGAALRNGTKISGATTATLTVSNVAPGDAGQYRVVITNAEGKVTSLSARLTVQ
jgi:hypothetical protein